MQTTTTVAPNVPSSYQPIWKKQVLLVIIHIHYILNIDIITSTEKEIEWRESPDNCQ